MTAPKWAVALLRRLAQPHEAEILIGDLEEAHRARVARSGAFIAIVLTCLEAADIAFMLLRRRVRVPWPRKVPRASMSWLDLKVGVRMLVRYPVLTTIGTLSLAFAIAIGAAVFAFISLILWPSLPLPDGDRIVSVRLHDDATSKYKDRITADFLRWRNGTTTLTDLGAGRGASRNLTMGDGVIEPVTIAEVTASTFGLARVTPLMGRVLSDDDARAAAPSVMVIGQRLWRDRFAADPAIVGRQLMLGQELTTVVGVVPEAFRFPTNFEVWQPLRMDEAAAAPRQGPEIRIWARFKGGANLDQVKAEFDALGAQARNDWPSSHARLTPEVRKFAGASMTLGPVERTVLASVNIGIGLLVFLISGNVALLMFARAATRESEIMVRSALGASRARLIAQFFAESLVLSAIAAVVGLLLAKWGIHTGLEVFTLAANDGRPLPFWFTPRLPPIAIAYGVGLAVLSAVVTGVLPALKVTRGLSLHLRASSAGGGGLKFGGVWTALIVTQIALTLAFPVVMYYVKRDAWQIQAVDISVPPSQYLSARLMRDSEMTPELFVRAVRTIREGLPSAPGVARVTLADKLPLMWHGHYVIEVDAGGAAATEGEFGDGYRISTAAVDHDFFAGFEAAPLAGRFFTSSDYVGRPRVAVVNQSFVERVLGGRNPIGRRVRYTDIDKGAFQHPPTGTGQPWIEIVGLVRAIGMAVAPDPKVAGLYIPLDLTSVNAVYVTARVSGDLAAATSALRALAVKADPTLRVTEVQPLANVTANALREIDFWMRMLAVVTVSGLMLSLSGIYAVMSFAVSRRTREIGIRLALGSNRVRVVLAVLRRPLIQVAWGIAFGTLIAIVLGGQISLTLTKLTALGGYVVVMVVVCLLAGLVPIKRALKVDPISALRTE